MSVDGTRHASEESIDTKRQDLIPGDINTLTSCCNFVLPYGIPGQSDPGVMKTIGNEESSNHKNEDKIKIIRLKRKTESKKVERVSERVPQNRGSRNVGDTVGSSRP